MGLLAWTSANGGQEALATLAVAPASPSAEASDAPATSTRSMRWQESLDAFAAADRARPPPAGGVVFVGSSSIRLWDDLEKQFDGVGGVVRRGFGGSLMADAARHVDHLVIPYRPRVVVVYAGENDLSAGRSPTQVLASFRDFAAQVHRALPTARIAYVSIKPSPRRAHLIPLFVETNALFAQYASETEGVEYIDVFSRMLTPEGTPRPELFRSDALHLSGAGYALWAAVISDGLR